MSYNQARLRRLNTARTAAGAEYVLYWMQAARRLAHNHALDYALACARELGRPLVVYEGLCIDYPWASRRLHRFVIEGMQANAAGAARLGLHYWPFVETHRNQGRGLLRSLAAHACLLVTDDFPAFIVPAQSEALARKVEVPVFHKAFAEAWARKFDLKLYYGYVESLATIEAVRSGRSVG